MTMKQLDERQKQILLAVIQSNIDLNMPIGSMLIAKRFSIGYSPATIRNIMAGLEKLGYITQPHRSAGRVPTEKGFKFFANLLLNEEYLTMNSSLSDELSRRLQSNRKDTKVLLREAAKTLSSFSRYLAIATPPNIDDMVFQRIKFIKYEGPDVLTILISDDGNIHHKIIHLDKIYPQLQLDRAAGYLNDKFGGCTIRKIREEISFRLYKEKIVYDDLVDNLLYLCREIMPADDHNISLNEFAGTSNLTNFATMYQIREILEAIEDKRFMLKLLNNIRDTAGTQVLVGMENILPSLKELSMVISTYNNKKQGSGAVGIIGPTRMNYKELIPVVDLTAKALTRILSENL